VTIEDSPSAKIKAIPDIDIWRCANVMMKPYGEDAALEAAYLADACSIRATWVAAGSGSGSFKQSRN